MASARIPKLRMYASEVSLLAEKYCVLKCARETYNAAL
jgi:hypothetical protein